MTRERYPVIHGPLPPHLVTLDAYGTSIGRSKAYIQGHWRPVAGFPQPVNEMPSRGRHGGGRGELVYRRAALEWFRREHDNLWGLRSTRLIVGHDPRERVTREEFAAICATCGVTLDPAPRRRPASRAGADGRRTLRAMIAWHNALPAAAGPALAVTPLGPDELVTQTGFARLVDVHPTTVFQYRDDPDYPPPADADGKLYRLGALAAWWNSRPGKSPTAGARKGARPARRASEPDVTSSRRRARTATATAARVERALEILGADVPRRLVATGRLRVAHPGASLKELSQLSDPPVSKDTIAYRLRRLLAMADRRDPGAHLPGAAPESASLPVEPKATAAPQGRSPRPAGRTGRELKQAKPARRASSGGRPAHREDRATTSRVTILEEANQRRQAGAAPLAAARAGRALEILSADAPESLAAAGRLRAAHPQASLKELGQLADPPLTKDAIATRLRRLLAMADRRAADLGLPGTGA